jgi:peroxiredoxin
MKYFTTVLVFLTMILFLGCSGKTEQSKTEDTKENTQANGTYIENVSEVFDVQNSEGGHVPNFSWTDKDGKKVDFATVAKGKAVLINFWATWCSPCRAELPDLVQLDKEIRAKDAFVLGISVDRDADAVTMVHKFAKENKLNYPIAVDNGQLSEAFGGIRGIPTSFFVDRQGVIKRKMIGAQSKETFSSVMKELM